jgi:RNA polymerase sigma-70 factor, ECF subfamily
MEHMNIERILFTYEKKIHQFFLKKTYNRDDVDDLVQEAMCQIITSIHSFSGKSHISTWIYAVCKNVFYHYLYQREKQKRIINKMNCIKHASSHDFQSSSELKILIESLSDKNKMLFDLFYRKKYTIKEISGLLHKPPGTIKYYLYQLRNAIKRICG